MSYTVKIVNKCLGTVRYQGTYETFEEAEREAREEASRSRSFASFEVWTGSPREPRSLVLGSLFIGEK